MTVSESPKPLFGSFSKNDIFFLFVITLITFATCIGYWWSLGWSPADAPMSWRSNAEVLLDERRFSSTIAPFTTLYYALWMAILGKTTIVLCVASLFAFLVNNVLVFLIARQLSSQRGFSYTVSLLASFHPFLVLETVRVGYEILSILFINLFILTVFRFSAKRTVANAAWVGVVCGISAFVKSALFALGIIFVLYCLILLIRERSIRILYAMVTGVLICAAIVSTWMTRNWMVEGYFALADPNYTIMSMYHGNNPWATKGLPIFENDCPPELWDIRAQIAQLGDPAKIGQAYADEIRSFIRSDPFYWYGTLGLKKLWCAFKFYARDEILYWGPLLPLAIAGLFTLGKQGVQGWLLHLILFNYALSSYLYFGFSRYRIPYVVVLLFLACHALFYFKERISARFFYLAVTIYVFLFLGAYSFAKILRVLWHYFVPQLRM